MLPDHAAVREFAEWVASTHAEWIWSFLGIAWLAAIAIVTCQIRTIFKQRSK